MGSLLNIKVVPLRSIGVVAPLDHVCVQVLVGLGETLENAVDESHGLGAGDAVVRTESAVGVTGDPAVVGCRADFVLRPVVCDVAERCSGGVRLVVKASRDSCELGTGDGSVRVELAVAVALHDAHSA